MNAILGKKPLVLLISLTLLAGALRGILWGYRTFKGDYLISRNLNSEHWQDQAKRFQNMEAHTGSVVLLGNSHVEKFPEEILDKDVINQGIGGDVTKGILQRLEATTQHQPEQVFLMIGINDIIARVPMEEITSNYREILEEIKRSSPHTTVYINSLLPTSIKNSWYIHYQEINQQVERLNDTLLNWSKEEQNWKYLDLYPEFEDSGKLRKDLTADQLHLNRKGYEIWGKEINQQLNNSKED